MKIIGSIVISSIICVGIVDIREHGIGVVVSVVSRIIIIVMSLIVIVIMIISIAIMIVIVIVIVIASLEIQIRAKHVTIINILMCFCMNIILVFLSNQWWCLTFFYNLFKIYLVIVFIAFGI